MRFRYYFRVRYGECDAQKIVFNARYADYIDLACLEFLRAIGFGEALIEGDLDYQTVKMTIEYKSPARFDQVLEAQVHAARLGNTSFTLATEFRLAGREPLVATAEGIYVLVDARSLTKTPLPRDFRAALESGAAGAVTDHAGYLSRRERSGATFP